MATRSQATVFLLLLAIWLGSWATAGLPAGAAAQLTVTPAAHNFLPAAMKAASLGGEPTPSSTTTPLPTATPTPSTAEIIITAILYNGIVPSREADEYVELANVDSQPVALDGWRLHDRGENFSFIFPSYTMQPGERCRVYTNELHPEWCGFSFGHGSAVWNNDNNGDTATLRDGSGRVVASCSYVGGGDEGTVVGCGNGR